MDCQQAQDMILLSDDPATAVVGGSALAQHVGGCADCQSLVARLTRIESVAAGLPAPVEGSQAARLRTLERVRAEERTPSPLRRLIRRPAFIGAIAASLLVALGITAWMWPDRQSVRQQAVVEELIDFDEALAAATPQEREQLYAEQAPVLRSAVEHAPLSEADRRLAQAVLDAPANQALDPVARAERLGALSDLLVRQMGPAAAANDELAIQRLGRRFGRVQRGIGAHRNDKGVADVVPERSLQGAQRLELQSQRLERMEQVRKRQEEARKRLQRLAERSPQKAQKQLQRMLENAERQRQQAPAKRPATQPRLDPDLH
jgi:hypothetical protein